jgi:hypothetical protein
VIAGAQMAPVRPSYGLAPCRSRPDGGRLPPGVSPCPSRVMPRPHRVWSDNEITTLRRLLASGLTRTEIRARLGRTREAVSGEGCTG